MSISNNIAEEFERGTTKDLLHFIYIARGSSGEVRSMLCVMDRVDDFSNLKSDISDLKADSRNISRQLRGWANSLQNSDIEGQRYLTDQTRQDYENEQRRAAFLESRREFRQEIEERLNTEAAERAKPK